MRQPKSDRRTLVLIAAVAATLGASGVALAQTKIYPQGSDCANQPTIAERLLCGRQELRREKDSAVQQSSPVPPADEPEPFSAPPAPPGGLALDPEQGTRVQPHTASPRH
jgi:hypothetical protein